MSQPGHPVHETTPLEDPRPTRDVERGLEALERSPMVSWFHPVELLRTGLRLAFSRQIAGYFDRRELQAALPGPLATPVTERSGRDGLLDADLSPRREVWIDFLSDVADGWDPAYTMASLVARKELVVEGLARPLPRADLLVLGGDQVYPAPSRDAYRIRFRGPFTAALPDLGDGERTPLLVAIPGDHDWYDGLTHFLRTFCQGGRVGAWRCVQRRSYFSVKLPHGWSLWGLDIPHETRIDGPQLDRFDRLARESGSSGERVILCAHAPTWSYVELRGDEAHQNLAFFEDRVSRAGGVEIPLTLAGRHHCYHRYEAAEGRQWVTAGGGGAYLSGTHHLPRRIRVPDGERGVEGVESGFPFPSRTRSRRLALGALRLPLLRVNLEFCILLGLVYALLAWSAAEGPGLRLLLLGSLVLLGFGAFCRVGNLAGSRWGTWLWGGFHGAAHVVLALLAARSLEGALEAVVEPGGAGHTLALYGGTAIVGALGGGFLVGLYLVLSDRGLGWHANEVFSCQAIADYKNFVRMHIDEQGGLTLYPIGVRCVPRRWRRRWNRKPGQPLIEPTHEEGPAVPHLIEGPIRVERAGRAVARRTPPPG